MQVDEVGARQEGIVDVPNPVGHLSNNEKEFGAWLMPHRRYTASRGQGGSRSGSRGGSKNPNSGGSLGDDAPDADA